MQFTCYMYNIEQFIVLLAGIALSVVSGFVPQGPGFEPLPVILEVTLGLTSGFTNGHLNFLKN